MKKYLLTILLAAFAASNANAGCIIKCITIHTPKIDVGPVKLDPLNPLQPISPKDPIKVGGVTIPTTPKDVVKVAENSIKATGDAVQVAGDGIAHAANELGKIVKQGFKDAKNGLPYWARWEACMATVCYSEVRLKQKQEEEIAKQKAANDELEAKLKADAVKDRAKTRADILDGLKKELDLVSSDEKNIQTLIEYNTMLTGVAQAEIKRRNDLKNLGTDYVNKVGVQEGQEEDLIRFLNDHNTDASSPEVAAQVMKKIADTKKALNKESTDVVLNAMVALDTQTLQKIIDNANIASNSLQEELTTLTEEKADAQAKYEYYNENL